MCNNCNADTQLFFSTFLLPMILITTRRQCTAWSVSNISYNKLTLLLSWKPMSSIVPFKEVRVIEVLSVPLIQYHSKKLKTKTANNFFPLLLGDDLVTGEDFAVF